jgi:hypothetical protein
MLDQIHAFIMEHSVASGSIVIVFEFILRLIPSEKPIGIIHMISGISKKLGGIFGGIASFLDSILPQKLK